MKLLLKLILKIIYADSYNYFLVKKHSPITEDVNKVSVRIMQTGLMG